MRGRVVWVVDGDTNHVRIGKREAGETGRGLRSRV